MRHATAPPAVPAAPRSRPVPLGVVTTASPREGVMWPLEAFTIFDDSQVNVELLAARVRVTAPSEIELYEQAFAKFTQLAVFGAEARALILRR